MIKKTLSSWKGTYIFLFPWRAQITFSFAVSVIEFPRVCVDLASYHNFWKFSGFSLSCCLWRSSSCCRCLPGASAFFLISRIHFLSPLYLIHALLGGGGPNIGQFVFGLGKQPWNHSSKFLSCWLFFPPFEL